jgi:hypothetical protein
MRMRWRGPAAVVNYGPILSSKIMLYKGYESKYSVKKLLVVSLKWLVVKKKLIDGKSPVVK